MRTQLKSNISKNDDMQPFKILISACLFGDNVRYDGNNKLLEHPILSRWKKDDCLFPVCPEVAGGLPVPRPAAEIQSNQQGRISIETIDGLDVSSAFSLGAECTLKLCLNNDIKIAILTDGSPSCGSQTIHDGSFQSKKIMGMGITTKLLRENNISVFSEGQIQQAYDLYLKLIDLPKKTHQ